MSQSVATQDVKIGAPKKLAPPRRKITPGERARSRDSALDARKSIVEPPSIHVVDGWAYAGKLISTLLLIYTKIPRF